MAKIQISEFENNNFIISGIINKDQLKAVLETFEPLSKSWRGQYQELAKEIVNACNIALSTSSK